MYNIKTEFIISICCLKATTESGVGGAAALEEDEKNIPSNKLIFKLFPVKETFTTYDNYEG